MLGKSVMKVLPISSMGAIHKGTGNEAIEEVGEKRRTFDALQAAPGGRNYRAGRPIIR